MSQRGCSVRCILLSALLLLNTRLRLTFCCSCCDFRSAALAGAEHMDLKRARTVGDAEPLVARLESLLSCAGQAATASVGDVGVPTLQARGLACLARIVTIFAPQDDPDVPGFPLLRQYEAQLNATLRPGLSRSAVGFIVVFARSERRSLLNLTFLLFKKFPRSPSFRAKQPISRLRFWFTVFQHRLGGTFFVVGSSAIFYWLCALGGSHANKTSGWSVNLLRLRWSKKARATKEVMMMMMILPWPRKIQTRYNNVHVKIVALLKRTRLNLINRNLRAELPLLMTMMTLTLLSSSWPNVPLLRGISPPPPPLSRHLMLPQN